MVAELKLKLKDLTWLGKAFENNTIISPFALIDESGFNEDDKNRLVQLGVIDKENNIKADYYPMLEILSKADGFIETKFKRGPVQARKFIMTSEDKKVSLSYKGEEAIINMPANPNGMAEYLKEFMGGSKLTGGDLSLEADAKEVFVLSVICDLYRKDVFKAYSEEEVFVYKGFTKEELLKAVNTIRENSQSLAYHIFALNDGFEEFTAGDIENIIESLEHKDLIRSELVQLKLNIETSVGESTPTEAGIRNTHLKKWVSWKNDKDNTYFPAGEGLLFAGNFLIIENIIEVTVGQVKQGKLYRSGFTILQAGPLDILYIESSEDKIIMQCMSSDNAVSFIATVLSEKPNI